MPNTVLHISRSPVTKLAVNAKCPMFPCDKHSKATGTSAGGVVLALKEDWDPRSDPWQDGSMQNLQKILVEQAEVCGQRKLRAHQ